MPTKRTPAPKQPASKFHLYWGDNMEVLPRLDKVKCIFADPPDNIDLGYGEYKDKMPDDQYVALLRRWFKCFINKAEIIWLSFNARWTPQIGRIVSEEMEMRKAVGIGEIECKPCVQVFTFGQHNNCDLGNNHRPLWRINHIGAKLYPDAIRVPSWRQRNGDKRAAEGGRVPGDVFDMQYPVGQFSVDGGEPRPNPVVDGKSYIMDPLGIGAAEAAADAAPVWPGDVFDFPRVTGNSKQRCDWHPTQLHEELVKRCVLLSTSDADRTIDPFGGTGTTLRVCRELDRPCTLIELDSDYCARIAEANGLRANGFDMLMRARRWDEENSKFSTSGILSQS